MAGARGGNGEIWGAGVPGLFRKKFLKKWLAISRASGKSCPELLTNQEYG